MKPVQLSGRARLFVMFMLALIVLIWMAGLTAYSTLPETIPTHFGLSGKADAVGSKSLFLFLPIVFSLAPAVILLVIRFRFTLINKYPYLLSLPAFFMIFELPPERRGYWLNRYFELVLLLGTGLVLFLLLLLLGIYKGTLDGEMPSWFLAATLVAPLVLVLPFVLGLRSIALRIAEERQEDL